MKPVQFLSNSAQISNIIKGLTISKSLFVSVMIIGEPHTGKKSLVKMLFPNSKFIDANNEEKMLKALDSYDEVIIYNFEEVVNPEMLNFENKRVIAIANKITNSSAIENKFAFIYHISPLREREEDVKLLTEYFSNSIKEEFSLDNIEIEPKYIDLSENIKSLKASIYKKLTLKSLTQKDIENLLFDYLYKSIDGNNAYREYLPLFEKPLIEAGLAKFKSQLKLSTVLGLNRNTLRKKIYELGID
ncbi:MAG TPA: Fis family transcriptional regulator [Campylobacterales bacterium]|nr:Fis family transcriptional regulator [Campylobacterales bacterium]